MPIIAGNCSFTGSRKKSGKLFASCALAGLCLEKLNRGAEAESVYRLAMQTAERPESLCLQFFGYTDYFPALRMTSICRRAGRIAEARAWNTAARKACPQGLEWKWDAILLRGVEKSPPT